ncbi:MAG: hypothetical protein ACREP6_04120 [Candidatus Binataceae bacterium]
MRLLHPLRIRGFIMYLPQFARLFYRLMTDSRVSLVAKLVPFLGLIILFSPPSIGLDFIPIIGELDWLLVAYVTLKVFLWLCPPEVVREHVARIGHGA